jgi:hypothetical protein
MNQVVMPLGALTMCFGCLLCGIHQEVYGYSRGHWLTYLGLGTLIAGGGLFVLGAGLIA